MKDFQATTKRRVKQLRKKHKALFEGVEIVILPLILFITFLILYAIHLRLEKEIVRYDLSSFTDVSSLSPYPVLNSAYTPSLSAQSAIIMDDGSKVILYAKNPNLRFSMASTTKLMTALVALEQFALDDILIVYSEGVEGSVVGLRKGEQYTLESILYAMLLPSANDAAYTIADNYPGGRDAFIRRMNEKAKELHLDETKYDDPAGLADDANFTTAVDLAHLASIAIKNKTISEVTSTKIKVISDISGTHTMQLENLNKLLGTNGVVGIKTGFTQGAGGVLATAKEENGHLLIIIVMRSLDRFSDTEQLVLLVNGQVSYVMPAYTSAKKSTE